MKANKFIVVVILLTMLGFSANAQDKKVEFGLMGGYGNTMPKLKDTRAIKIPAIDESNMNGFHFGPILKFNLSELISFQTGLLFNRFSGININSSQLALKKLGTWYQERTKLVSFDLPLRAMYSIPLADEFNVFLFAGPNLNYSINKVTITERYAENKLKNKSEGINIYQSPSNFNALDLQMGAGVGIQFMGVSLRGGYDWGVLNRTTLTDAALRANDFKVSLAYTF